MHPPPHHNKEQPYVGDKFPSPLFLNFAQALASSLSAFLYLTFKAWRDCTLSQKGLTGILGISGKAKPAEENGLKLNGSAEKSEANGVIVTPKLPLRSTLPALLFQVSVFQTLAGPIGFLALRHISYPTMVLGKVSRIRIMLRRHSDNTIVLQVDPCAATQCAPVSASLLTSQISRRGSRYRRDQLVYAYGRREREEQGRE